MKITTANAAPERANGNISLSPSIVPGSIHWVVSWNQGVTEPGSSGSPIFDNQTHRIIGQLSGGPSGCGNSNQKDAYGRFDASWDGGGTSTTRLRDWLDPTNIGTMDLASTAIPSVSGPNFFCTTAQFVLNDAPPGAPVTWSVSPSTSISPSSGSGTTANITLGPNGNIGVDATITFFVGCAPAGPVSYNFHAGDYSVQNYPITGPANAGCNQNVSYSAPSLPGATSYIWNWSNSGWTYQSGLNSPNLTLKTNNSSGTVALRVGACGGQGGGPATLFTSVSGCFARATVYPNPGSQLIQVEFEQTDVAGLLPGEIILYSEGSTKPLRTINMGEVFSRKAFREGNKVDIDVRDLPRGVYYIHLIPLPAQKAEVERIRLLLN